MAAGLQENRVADDGADRGQRQSFPRRNLRCVLRHGDQPNHEIRGGGDRGGVLAYIFGAVWFEHRLLFSLGTLLDLHNLIRRGGTRSRYVERGDVAADARVGFAFLSGSETVTVVPSPTGCTFISPPCSATRPFTIDRPRPVPSWRRS